MSDSSKAYPRGRPYKAPETVTARPADPAAPAPPADAGLQAQIALQEARLRRWIQLLVFSTVGSLFIVAITGFILVRQIRAQVNGARAEQPEPKNEQAPPIKPADRVVIGPDNSIAKEKPPESGKTPEGTSKSDAQRERMLSALGNLTGVHLYQAYLNIGLLADCTESEVYTSEEAQKWLERTLGQLELVDKQLDALANADLDAEERQGIDRCRRTSALLRVQAMELREYWKKSDKDHAARYHKAREAAWASVSEVLQIPKE
jgi:hypothetical protein